MKLTPAEYKLLDALNSTTHEMLFISDLKQATRRAAKPAISKGLISKRAWSKGYVVATALGKRSHARGKS